VHQLLAIVSGLLVAAQGAINSGMKGMVGSAVIAALINNLVGACALAAVLVFSRSSIPSGSKLLEVPGYYWLAGVLGASFIWTAATVIPKLGVSTTLALVISGQLVGALLIDHFGLLGVQQRAFSWPTWVGLALVVVGALLLTRTR